MLLKSDFELLYPVIQLWLPVDEVPEPLAVPPAEAGCPPVHPAAGGIDSETTDVLHFVHFQVVDIPIIVSLDIRKDRLSFS